jgi:4-carboxymuconolactone decarboxylase
VDGPGALVYKLEQAMDDGQYRRGIEQFARMVGAEGIDGLRERLRRASPDFEEQVMGFVGGEVWTRPNLDLKTRSLCSIAVLAGLGRVNALELNIRMALRNGASREEIVEVFFQVAVYAGFAAAWDGLERAARVFDELAAG